MYTLLNCQELSSFSALFDSLVRQQYPYLSDEDLSKYRDNVFTPWLNEHVSLFAPFFSIHSHSLGLSHSENCCFFLS